MKTTMQTLAAKIEGLNARLKAVEALEEQLANALTVFDAAPSVVQPTQDVILRLDKIEERLTMKILPPDLTARALALAHSVSLSNNGRADSTDVEAVDALHRAGYVVGLSANQHPALPVTWTVSTRAAWEAEVRSMIDEVSA